MRNLRRSRVVRRVFSALLCMALLIGSINVSGLTARADIGNDPEQPVYTLTEPAPSEDGQIQELPDVTNHAQENDIVNSEENSGTLVPENPTQVPEEPGEVAGEEQTTPEENPEEGQTLPEENPEEEPASPQEQPDAADTEPDSPEVNPEQVPEASGENPEQGQTAPEVNPEQGQTVPEENKDQDPAPQQEQPGAAEVTPDAPEVNPEQVPETPAENPEQEQPVPADGAGNEGQNLPAELPQNAEGSDAGKTEEQLSEENTSNEETEENAEIDYDALSETLEDTWMITAGERVNVREIPDAEGGIVAVIKEKGARVQVLARYTEDWLKIRIAAEDAELPAETADESAAETMDYVTGYVRADLLREERKYSYDADDLGDHEELEDMDFSARRLIVAIDDSDEIVEEESVLAVYEPVADAADDTPVYLLSFDTEEKTKIAYLHYLDEAEFAEPDVALFVTDRSDDAAQEDADDAQKKEARRADEGTDASEDDDADPEDETPDYELPEFGASDQSQEENAFDLLTEEMEKLLAEQEEQEEERRRRKEAEEEAPHGMEDEDASEEAEDEAEEEEDESPVIALLSTGVGSESGSYEALARRVNFVPDGDDYDLNGNGTGLYGILTEEAEDAKILSVSVLDEDGRGDLSMLYAGILYAAQYGADYIVLPMTAYLPDGSEALRSAIRFAEDKDITVIAAAGDFAEDAEDFVPASYGAVITAGAAKENGARRRASNYGSDVDVNVVAVDTAEAAARLAGILCREGITAEDFEELTLNEGAVFETGYVPPEKDLYARTTAEKVNVRAQASTDSDIVAVIGQKGTRVQVLYIIEQEDVWYRVRLLPNGKTQMADDEAQEGDTGEEDEDAEESVEGYIRSDLAELIEGDGAGYLYTEEELEALEEADFSAQRLIVSIPETEIVEEESVLAVYTPDGDESDEEAGLPVYLLQFDTEEEAKIAYLHYSAFAAFAEPDRTMRAAVIAESTSDEDDMSETASGDAEESRKISMSEDVNPLTVLEDLLEELEEKRAADREAAEQETQNEAPIRQQEDADTSSEHSQERRAVRQQEDGDEEVPSDEAEADNAPEDAAGDETVSGSDTAEITAEDIRKETHTVAVLTSGVGAASASYRNLAGRVSLLGDDGHDTNGQGTRLYETILNAADNAQILPVKVLDENGEGAVSAVYAGILYAAQYGAEYLVLPVTMYTPETSGLSEQSAALRSAIDLTCEAGITVIAAAGDHGADAADFMPASADRVITAGSAAEDGLRRETSNYGDDVDVNVTSQTTGEAAARLAGILCAEEITADTISDLKTNLYGGAVFTTSFTEADLRYPGGVLRAEEGGCEITLTYDENAMIVPDAELRVKELTASDSGDAAESNADSYESMLALALQAAGEDGSPEKNLPENVRLFTLQVVRAAEDGTEQEIISRAPVAIGIAPGDMKTDSKEEDVSVVRFVTENDVLQAVKVEGISVSDQISFTQEHGTGTYGVFYNGGAKPAFHEIKEVDGIRISVQAEEGVFPEGATLSVTKIEAPDAASGAGSAQGETDAQQVLDEVEKAVSSVRGKNRNVALTQTFDIKVLSRSGVEIQPTDAAKVKVSFTMAAVENKNLDMQVYHLAEPQKQSGTESADTVEQSADENPEASAEPAENANENANETADENADTEAVEEQTEQIPSADVPAEEGIYRAESLEVVTDGSTATVETGSFSLYTVEFTYGELVYIMEGGTKLPLRTILDTLGLVGTPTAVETSNRALLSASNKSGEWIVTSYQAFSTEEWMKVTIDGIDYMIIVTDSVPSNGTFAQDADLAEFIINTSVFTRDNVETSSGGIFNIIPGSLLVYDASTNRLKSTSTSFTQGIEKYLGSASITFKNAATDSTGSDAYNIVINYKDITVYPYTSQSYKQFDILSVENSTTSSVYPRMEFGQTGTGQNVGIRMDVEISIVDANSGSPVPDATFFYSFNDFNTNRSATWPNNRYSYEEYLNFNEAVRINGDATYYKDDNAGSKIRNGWYVPGYAQASIGSLGGQNSEVVAYASGGTASASLQTQLMSSETGNNRKIVNFMPDGMTHSVSLQSEEGGKYEVYSNGAIDGVGTLLYRGRDRRTYDVADGKTVVYKLIPDEAGGIVSEIVGDGGVGTIADGPDDDGNGDPDYFIYTLPASVITDQDITVKWQKSRMLVSSTGPHGSYEIYDVDDNNRQIYSGREATRYPIDDNHAAKYIFMPDDGYRLKILTVNGVEVTNYTTGTDAGGNTTYELDIPQDLESYSVHVTWSYLSCDDCKNPQTCEDCSNAIAGDNMEGYESEAPGVYRGGDAKTKTDWYSDDDRNTFIGVLPYGNVYIDVNKVKEEFKVENFTAAPGAPFYFDDADNGSGSDSNHKGIKYNGGTKAYIAGVGTRNNIDATALAQGDTVDVGMLDKASIEGLTNAPANAFNAPTRGHSGGSSGEILTNSGGYGRVVDGTNIIKASNNNQEYLYQINYKGAAILPDGSRGDVILTVTEIDLETVYDADEDIRVQKANEFCVHYMNTSTLSTSDGTRPNAIGIQTTWNIHIEKDGDTIPGYIMYACNDMDFPSAQSMWGRQWNDPINYSEGMQVLSGAAAYAVVPTYNRTGSDRNSGWGPYDAPSLVDSSSADGTANGMVLRSDGILNTRAEDGTFIRTNRERGVTDNSQWANLRTPELLATLLSDHTGTTTPELYYRNTWYQRNDRNSYDTGFATILDATGSTLKWTGSSFYNGSTADNVGPYPLNTNIFDTNGMTYLIQSHGTGGGLHTETYRQTEGCEASFEEGVITLGSDVSATISIVPEDGYRVAKIYLDDILVEIDDENGTAVIGGTPIALDGTDIRTISSITGDNGQPLQVAVTRNSDRTYDVKLTNVKSGLNVHADFDTDYYFQKIWEGTKTVPDSVSFTAVPYEVIHDSVKIGNATYKIETQILPGGGTAVVYENVDDPADKCAIDDNNSVIVNGDHCNTVTLKGNRYAIIGNELQEIEKINNIWTLKGWAYSISTVLGRYAGSNISEQKFTVDINSDRSQIIVDNSNPSKTIWKIKYPAEGTANWPALPLEADGLLEAGPSGTTNAGHDAENNHVQRIYWFANEDLSNLNEEWLLKSYDNIDNGNVWMPGIVSNSHYDKAKWYTLATEDHAKISDVMEYMSDIQLAAMTPIYEDTTDYQGAKVYSGHGGIVTNQSIETKLKVVKNWTGDRTLTENQRKEYRQKLALNIHRDYIYSQPRFNDVSADESRVTFVDGPTLNSAMIAIAGGTGEIDAFRRGVEPSTNQKINAKRIASGDTSSLTPGDVAIVDDNTTQTDIYMWFADDGTTGVIYYWTDADHIFLNQDSSQLFSGMNNLSEITGLFGVNSTKARDMSEMFYVPSGDGSLENLDYLRSFDTALVTNLEKFVAGQSSLSDISGIIDWNVGRVPEDGTGSFDYMFQGVTNFLYDDSDPSNVKKTFPFVYFPNAQIDENGNLVDAKGETLVTQGQRADADDLRYDVSKDFDTDTSNDNENNAELVIAIPFVPGNATKIGDSSVTYASVSEAVRRENKWMDADGTTIYQFAGGEWCTEVRFDDDNMLEDSWTWVVDDLLLNSDPNKWSYDTFEDDIQHYSVVETDGESKQIGVLSNHAPLKLNTDTGYYEYAITNAYMPTLTVSKEVTGSVGSRDKYFKFEVTVKNVAPGTILDLIGVKKYEEDDTNDATVYQATDIKTAHEIDQDIDKEIKYSEVSADSQRDYEWKKESDVYKYASAAWYKLSGGTWTRETPPADAVVKYCDVDSETAKSYAWKAADGTVYRYVGPDWYPSEPDDDSTILLDPSQAVEYQLLDRDSARKYIWEKDGKIYLYRGSVWVYLNDPVPGDAVRPQDSTIDYDTYTQTHTDEKDYVWEKDGVRYEYNAVLNSWVTEEEPPADATFGATNTEGIQYVEMDPNQSQTFVWRKNGVDYYYRDQKWWVKGTGSTEVEQSDIPADAIIVVSTGLTAEDMTFDTISDKNARELKWTKGSDTYEYLPGHWYKVDDTDTATNGDTDPKNGVTVPDDAVADRIGRTGQQIVCTKDGTPTGSTISDGTVNDKSGWITFYVYLQHGQEFKLEGLPGGAEYTVKEFYEDYKPSVKITGDKTTNDGDSDDSNDKAIELNKVILAKTASVSDTAILDNTELAFTNRRNASIPTEVRFGITAGLLGPLMMIVIGLRYYFHKRRRRLVRYADGTDAEIYDDFVMDEAFFDMYFFRPEEKEWNIHGTDDFYYVDFTSDSDSGFVK